MSFLQLARLARDAAVDAGSHAKLATRRLSKDVVPTRGHGLANPVVVSLTSYPARFPTLALTLESLLMQSVSADVTVLWIAEGDVDALPADVLNLKRSGLTISTTADTRQYKKILPAIAAYPDALIITADDDVYYGRDWLSGLLSARSGSLEVLFYRGHQIRLGLDGLPAPYAEWQPIRQPGGASGRYFPTGVGGVLYEPGTFDAEVLQVDKAIELCPTADDIWLYFMAGINGFRWRKVGPYHDPRPWRRSQGSSLAQANIIQGANDRQFSRMIERYGADWMKS